MPIKRYFVALIVVSLLLAYKIWSSLLHYINPSELSIAISSRTPENMMNIFSIFGYAMTVLNLVIFIFVSKRIYSFIVKKQPLFVLSKYVGLNYFQKAGAFMLKASYVILFISVFGTLLLGLVVRGGGISGVPAGMALTFCFFLVVLSAIFIELGNSKNSRIIKSNKALQPTPENGAAEL